MKKLILALGVTLASTSSFAGINFSVGVSNLNHEMESHVRQETGVLTIGSEYFSYEGTNQMLDLGVGYDFNDYVSVDLKHSLSAGGDSNRTRHSGSSTKYWESHDQYNPSSLTDLSLKLSPGTYKGFKLSISGGVTAPNIEMGPSTFDKTLFNFGLGLSYSINKNMFIELGYTKYLENNMSQKTPSGYTVTLPPKEEGGENIVKKINNFEKMRWSGDKLSLGLKYAF